MIAPSLTPRLTSTLALGVAIFMATSGHTAACVSLPDFSLTDVSGQNWQLSQYDNQPKLTTNKEPRWKLHTYTLD